MGSWTLSGAAGEAAGEGESSAAGAAAVPEDDRGIAGAEGLGGAAEATAGVDAAEEPAAGAGTGEDVGSEGVGAESMRAMCSIVADLMVWAMVVRIAEGSTGAMSAVSAAYSAAYTEFIVAFSAAFVPSLYSVYT